MVPRSRPSDPASLRTHTYDKYKRNNVLLGAIASVRSQTVGAASDWIVYHAVDAERSHFKD